VSVTDYTLQALRESEIRLWTLVGFAGNTAHWQQLRYAVAWPDVLQYHYENRIRWRNTNKVRPCDMMILNISVYKTHHSFCV
jgi:hypothetical protein